MRTRTLTVSALGFTLLAGIAAASSDDYDRDDAYARRGPVPFEVMDLNGDGVVTADEHAQLHRERYAYRVEHGYPARSGPGAANFDQIDADGNGSLSRDELSDWQAQRMQQRGMGMGRGGRW